jgi:hypothetical protein
VLENKLLRRIFGPKREAVTGGYTKLDNEIHNLYSSINITVIKSRRTRWVGCVACTVEMKSFIRKI